MQSGRLLVPDNASKADWTLLDSAKLKGQAAANTMGRMLLVIGEFGMQLPVVVSACSTLCGAWHKSSSRACCGAPVARCLSLAMLCCIAHRRPLQVFHHPHPTSPLLQTDWISTALLAVPADVRNGRTELYLCASLLRCWQAPALAGLRSRWVEAGQLVVGADGKLRPTFDFVDQYPLVFKVGWLVCIQALGSMCKLAMRLLRSCTGCWRVHAGGYVALRRGRPSLFSCCTLQVTKKTGLQSVKQCSKAYNNHLLRMGLGQLALRLWGEEGDGDAAYTCGGQQYMLTPLGERLWHDSLHALFSSKDALWGLPMYWAETLPQASKAGQPPAWLKNPIVYAS